MMRYLNFSVALLAFATALSARASDSVRLAVISTAGAADLAALVATELSSRPTITLVERDALAKIGDEAKLQQLAGTDSVALGRLIGADGLLFMEESPRGSQARFTAVGLGFVVFQSNSAPGLELPVQARALADRIAWLVPKLKLPPDKAIPVSILNFRVDLTSQDPSVLEREITLLLESRLAAIPEYVVLERRHGDFLHFERSLATTAPDLLKGAFLIDGSIQPAAPNHDDLTAALRIRSPKTSQEVTLQVGGTTKDLHAFVELLAEKISAGIGTPVTASTWSPQTEAREYLQEGIWGFEHHSPRDALEALDSAAMLGETASDLLAVRAGVLCQLASQEPYFYGGKEIQPPAVAARERLAFLHRAMVDLREYREQKGESHLVLINPRRTMEGRTGEIGNQIRNEMLALLVTMESEPADPSVGSLRQEVRELFSFDPATGKFPWVENPDPLCESLDEERNYYRHRCLAADGWFPSGLSPDRFCPRFLKTPEEQKAAFDQFVQGLLADPQGKLCGLLLLTQSSAEAQNDAYAKFIDELWNRRSELYTSHRFRFYAQQASYLPEDLRKKYTAQTIPLLRDGLVHLGGKDGGQKEALLNYLWKPQWFPPESAAALWADYQTGKSTDSAPPPTTGDQTPVDAAAAEFLALFPQFKPPGSGSEVRPLIVNRYWKPPLPTPDLSKNFHTFAMTIDGDTVRMVGGAGPDTAGIYDVVLPGLQTTFLATECGPRPYDVVKTSKAFFVTYGEYPKGGGPIQIFLKRYDLAAKTWTTRQIAHITAGSLYAIQDDLYFNLWTVIGSKQECGLARYDWDHDQLTILASSRRRPAQNQFDDRAGYQIHGLFRGPGGRLCVNADGGIYQVLEKPGTWPRVFDFANSAGVVSLGRETLGQSFAGEVVLFNPDKSEPEPLMAPSEKPPAWSSQAVWKTSPDWGHPEKVGFHNGNLYALASDPQRPGFRLLWLAPGKTTPLPIPLRLQIDSSEEEAFKQGFLFPPHPGKPGNTLSLVTTDQGICLHEIRGFWFLPWSDLEAWLKAQSPS